jgi:hypothetical protein
LRCWPSLTTGLQTLVTRESGVSRFAHHGSRGRRKVSGRRDSTFCLTAPKRPSYHENQPMTTNGVACYAIRADRASDFASTCGFMYGLFASAKGPSSITAE